MQHPAPGLLPRGTLPKTAVAKLFRKTPWRRRPAAPEQFRLAIRSLIEQRFGDYAPGFRGGDKILRNWRTFGHLG